MTSLVSIQMSHIVVDDTVSPGVVDPGVIRVERSPLSGLRYLRWGNSLDQRVRRAIAHLLT